MTDTVDAARLTLALTELRLPAIKALWPSFAEQADREGWSAARLLGTLAEHELAERERRRMERHLAQARLLPGKTLESFDFNAVPMISKAHVNAIAAGDGWIANGANILIFGPPGVGKSHLSSAIGLELVHKGYRVLFTRTTDLVQKLQQARRDLTLESAIAKLDKFHLVRGRPRTGGGLAPHSSTTSPISPRIRPKHPSSSSSSAPDTNGDPC